MSRGRFDPLAASLENTTARPSTRLVPPRDLADGRALASSSSRGGTLKRFSALLMPLRRLVELTGLEPATPWLQTRCSPS